MNKREAIVFDLGKVLLDFDYRIAAKKLAAHPEAVDEVHRFIAQSPLLYRYETGSITRHQFFSEICQATGYAGEAESFCQCFSDIFTPIDSMVSLQQTVRSRGYPTYIFSNTNDLAIDHIRRSFPFFSGFDGYVLSYEHGAMKPEEKIYEVVETMTGRRGRDVVYIDDRLENIEAGAARGWRTILQETPAKTHAAFESFGLLA